MNGFRTLTQQEILALQQNGCVADDWNNIEVKNDFTPDNITTTHFSGKIRIGTLRETFVVDGGIPMKSGIHQARIHNCSIGDDCYINRINNHLSNYDIADNVFIENVNLMVTNGRSTFGNGTAVNVLNEAGGREVLIYDKLSSHIAYMMTLYRGKTVFIKQLKQLINSYCEQTASERGVIGTETTITNCGIIRNVKFGEHVIANGCSRLENGTIHGEENAPTLMGSDVIAQDFIVCSGSEVTDGAMLTRCFVGQACQVGKQYSATDTLFFCNCQAFHGESASVFAGPYTVTHHKASLLIAGMYSFLNVGSGSNQSNHLYKLGPLHQGVTERGVKLSSDSYLLWPAKIGAFSTVMGRHYNHPDTSLLPFSYLLDKDKETYLMPGANLRSAGTVRDAKKWEKRDNRHGAEKLDLINFNVLTPYSIQKIEQALTLLREMKSNAGEVYTFNNAKIKSSAVGTGINLYKNALYKFIGEMLLKHPSKPTLSAEIGEWVDLAGLIAPKKEVETIIQKTEEGGYSSIEDIYQSLQQLHARYDEFAWKWTYDLLQRVEGIDELTLQHKKELLEKWLKAVTTLNSQIVFDAGKEFSDMAKIGFGVDGDKESMEQDFENVRGKYETDKFIIEIEQETEDAKKRFTEWTLKNQA